MSQVRDAVRNFLCAATLQELRIELEISEESGDYRRAAAVTELISETVDDVDYDQFED